MDENTNTNQALQNLFDQYWEFTLRENPVLATSFGSQYYNDQLSEETPEAYERRAEQEQDFLRRLRELDREEASESNRLNYDLFERILMRSIRGYELGTHYLTFNKLFGFHISLPQIHLRIPLQTLEHYENYVKRLEKCPNFIEEKTSLLREGMKQNRVPPRNALDGVEQQLENYLVESPRESPYFNPFLEFPGVIPEEEQNRLRSRAGDVITEELVPALQDFKTFVEEEYLPVAPDSISCEDLPEGEEYYRYMIDKFTSTNLSPEEIHRIGMEEVNTLKSRMESIIDEVGFEGDFDAFVEHLRTDDQFYYDNEEELLRDYRNICKKMDARLPSLFGKLPRIPYGVREIPEASAEDAPTAYYMRPAGDGSTPGWFMANTSNLDSRPKYEMEALALHEAVPGHHLQIALQTEMTGLVDFRRVANFTAFVEGWGLYSEQLGKEVGFYRDPYSEFGRLSFSIWRACRLVVDTGIHHLGWNRKKAIDFMCDNSALSRKNVKNEIDRYIAHPGQALSYKIGERKILELRQRAVDKLGDRFSLRTFHDRILEEGAIPLDLLEERIDSWLESC